MKRIKQDLNKWKDMLCSWIGSLMQYRCQFFPGWYTGLTQFLSKFQQVFFVYILKIILKFIFKVKATRIANTFLKKKKNRRNKSNCKLSNHSHSNQGCVVLLKGQTYRSIEPNRELRNRLAQICPIAFYESVKKSQWRKNSLFNKWRWNT